MTPVPRLYQDGLSLIELILAMAIGVVLSFGVTRLFLHSKVSALQDEQMGRLQENGRYAMRYLRRELAMAGYLGSVVWGERIAPGPDGTDCFNYLLDPRNPLEHVNNVSPDGRSGSGDVTLAGHCMSGSHYVEGSDILVVRRTHDLPIASQGIQRAAPEPNAVYLRFDGRDGQASFDVGGGAAGPALDVLEYAPRVIFLRDYSISRGDGIPALCHKRLSRNGFRAAPVECLLEGVADMQIEFGLDDDGDGRADRYVDTVGVRELRSAVAARLFLMTRSVYRIPGYSGSPPHLPGRRRVPATGDGYFRQVLQTTVLLRNSLGFKS